MEGQHIPGIPNGNHSFRTWCDGNNYYGLDTFTKTVYGYVSIIQSCGCCDIPEDREWDWDNLGEEDQKLIIEEITTHLQGK